MVRGVNKKMVEVVEMDHEYFERAILIVREMQQEKDEPLLRQEASRYIKNLDHSIRKHYNFWHRNFL